MEAVISIINKKRIKIVILMHFLSYNSEFASCNCGFTVKLCNVSLWQILILCSENVIIFRFASREYGALCCLE